MLLVFAISWAGCLQGPIQERVLPCLTTVACLAMEGGAYPVVLHGEAPEAIASVEVLVREWTGRPIAVTHLPPLADRPNWNESALAGLAPGSAPNTLHIVVLHGTLLVAGATASGLSFPGQPNVFLFPDGIDLRVREANLSAERGVAARATIERVVAAHEFGHVLGLVGCGLPEVRAHGDGACHSRNVTSVMATRVARITEWPAWDSAATLGPFGFDADDAADLRSAGLDLA